MRVKIGVVDEVGILKVKTSKEQIKKVGEEEFKRRMGQALQVLLAEIEEALGDSSTSYIDKTVNSSRRRQLAD